MSSLRLPHYGFALLLLLGFAFLIGTSEGQWNSERRDRELLSDLRAVTFNAGRERAHRRVGGGPQLECVGGSAGCSAFAPQVVQCQQVGNEQWRCEADMPDDYAFGPVEVVCEGYEFPDDPYILKGSCSLEYNLELTPVGRQRRSRSQQDQSSDYGDDQSSWSRSSSSHRPSSYYPSSYPSSYSSSSSYFSSSSSFLTPIIIFGALIFLFRYLRSNNVFGLGAMGMGGPGPGGFFGGHGGNFPPGGGGGYPGGGYPGYPGGGCGGPRYGGGSGGPGFFSGLAAGGAMGYMFGNRGNNVYGHPPGYRAPSLFRTSGGGGFSSGGGGGGAASFGGTTRTAFGGGGTRRR